MPQPNVSNRQIARTVGVSHQAINNDLGNNLPEKAENANQDNDERSLDGNKLPPAFALHQPDRQGPGISVDS
jgi:hypothetical protein